MITETGRNDMTTTTAAPTSSEITGIPSLVAYLETVAGKHDAIGSGEGFIGSLNRMEVGADDIQLVADAQETSKVAAQAWKVAARQVAVHNLPLREQYSLNPQAGNKAANTNE